MKRILLLIAMILMAVTASAQPRGGRGPYDGRDPRAGRELRGSRDNRYRGSSRNNRNYLDSRNAPSRRDRQGRRGSNYTQANLVETPCIQEWQELWNGCHVRFMGGRITVLDRSGNRVVGGEEVSLLGNGSYKVRNGDLWRIYDWRGGFTIISGHEVHLWPNGLYLVRYSSSWRVYTAEGDRLTNVWGDRVELMSNGLIRCERAGRFIYYDERGNERR